MKPLLIIMLFCSQYVYGQEMRVTKFNVRSQQSITYDSEGFIDVFSQKIDTSFLMCLYEDGIRKKIKMYANNYDEFDMVGITKNVTDYAGVINKTFDMVNQNGVKCRFKFKPVYVNGVQVGYYFYQFGIGAALIYTLKEMQ